MSTDLEDAGAFHTWQATGWEDLRAIWAELIPVGEAPPRFRSQTLTKPQAGWVFERWILEAFRLSGASGHHPYRIASASRGQTREQIDGLIFDRWQGFLIESKFWRDKVNIDPIFRLHVLVEQRPAGTMGLFFSAFGFTDPTLESVESLRPIRVLLFDAQDLRWALEEPGHMMSMVKRKWLLALKYGRSHFPVKTEIDLFGQDSGNAQS